jgi:hypothetical protein
MLLDIILKSSSDGAIQTGSRDSTLESQTPSRRSLRTSHRKLEMTTKASIPEGVAALNRYLEAVEF